MPRIESFSGSWDSGSLNVTLTWVLADVTPSTVVKVGEGMNFSEVDTAVTIKVLVGRKVGSARYTLLVNDDDDNSERKQTTVQFGQANRPQQPTEDSLEDPAFVNTGFNWLTYETVLNKPKFRKTNQERKIGLYAADMAEMQLWVCDGMPDSAFQAIAESFFPDHTRDEVQRLSDSSWWWKSLKDDFEGLKKKTAPYYEEIDLKPPEEDTPGWLPDSLPALVGSRSILQLYLPRYVVMPYNYWDNDNLSRSLGTAGSEQLHPIPMIQVKQDPADITSWSMWRSASRSCVMKVNRVKAAYVPWPGKNWKDWEFSRAVVERDNFKNKNSNLAQPRFVNTAFRAEVLKTTQFKLEDLSPYHFSVKTGVAFVGFDRQDEKQIIGQEGEWLAGAMRSDTIRAIQQLAVARGAVANQDIIVQTEIMMVVERRISPAMSLQRFGAGQLPGPDGVALRDLTVLTAGRYYIPPLSIPFIAKDMKTLSTEFAHIDDDDWCGFWQKNWAEALGTAKGLFLVQYGMQTANPNVQNYLIEFTTSPDVAYQNYVAKTPDTPVKVLIRDVADALLVREVAWALFGPDETCPDGADDVATLAKMRLPILRYNFRSVEQAHGNETGSTNEQFGPPGVQFLWTRFSAFYVGNKPGKNGECPKDRLPKALRLTSRWGTAHSAAYVRTVEKALGVELGDIRWDEIYDDDHHYDRYWTATMAILPTPAQWEVFAKTDMQWEEAAAALLHTFLRGDGRKKLCDYHNRGWKEVTPMFSVRVLDAADEPMALTVVFCAEAGTGKILSTRMTDPAGEIPFYLRTYTHYDFWVASGALRKRESGASVRKIADKRKLAWVRDEGSVKVVKFDAITVIGSVTVAAPIADLSGTASPLSATATADAARTISSVRFKVSGNLLAAPVTATYDTTLDTTTLKNGPYPVIAEATDSTGDVTTSAAVTVTVNNPAPTVVMIAPPTGDVAGVVTLTAQATPGANMTLESVQFAFQDAKSIGSPVSPTASSSDFSTTLNADETKTGEYKIVAIAKDTAGNTTTSEAIVVKVTHAAPTVTITSPPAGAVAGVITLSADAAPGLDMTLDSVQFSIGGASREPALKVPPFTMTLNVTELKNGSLTITATAKDTVGNSTTSDPVAITVANPLPTIQITSPAAGPSGEFVILSADAQPGAGMMLQSVQFVIDETATGRLLTATPYQLDEIHLPPGDHTIKATVKDTMGNSATSAAVDITVS